MYLLQSLAQVFAKVRDSRQSQGRRHPLAGMLALVFLGLLARIRELAVLQRWAVAHWNQLREPLGFDRAMVGTRREDERVVLVIRNGSCDSPLVPPTCCVSSARNPFPSAPLPIPLPGTPD